jgi:hypothetical protein
MRKGVVMDDIIVSEEYREHSFKEVDRNFIGVVKEESGDKVLLGISGFDLKVVFDDNLNTIQELQEAAGALATSIIQYILDSKFKEGDDS